MALRATARVLGHAQVLASVREAAHTPRAHGIGAWGQSASRESARMNSAAAGIRLAHPAAGAPPARWTHVRGQLSHPFNAMLRAYALAAAPPPTLV